MWTGSKRAAIPFRWLAACPGGRLMPSPVEALRPGIMTHPLVLVLVFASAFDFSTAFYLLLSGCPRLLGGAFNLRVQTPETTWVGARRQ